MSNARPRGCMTQREQLPWERHPPIKSIFPPVASKSSMKATKLFLTEELTFALAPALELIVTSSARTEVVDNAMAGTARAASAVTAPAFRALLRRMLVWGRISFDVNGTIMVPNIANSRILGFGFNASSYACTSFLFHLHRIKRRRSECDDSTAAIGVERYQSNFPMQVMR